MLDHSKPDSTNLWKAAIGGCFAVLLLVCIGIFTQGVRSEIEFDIHSAADSPLQSYLMLNDVREAVPVSSGRFQLSRILQQLQGRVNGFSRLFTPRELFKSLQEWHWLLLAGLYCSCMLGGALYSRSIFQRYLTSITPCRAGPEFCL